jgi:hypothetical protein
VSSERRNLRVGRGWATPSIEPSGESEELPRLVLRPPNDPVVELLQRASLLLLKHPVAAQAAFAALVAEGRRFAETPEGRRWKAALKSSELAWRGHALWEGSLLKVLEERADSPLPTAILEALIQAASRSDTTALLQQVLEHEAAGS